MLAFLDIRVCIDGNICFQVISVPKDCGTSTIVADNLHVFVSGLSAIKETGVQGTEEKGSTMHFQKNYGYCWRPEYPSNNSPAQRGIAVSHFPSIGTIHCPVRITVQRLWYILKFQLHEGSNTEG